MGISSQALFSLAPCFSAGVSWRHSLFIRVRRAHRLLGTADPDKQKIVRESAPPRVDTGALKASMPSKTDVILLLLDPLHRLEQYEHEREIRIF